MGEHGLNRVDIASLCSRDTTTVGRWLKGEVPIPDDAKRKLTARFEVTVEYLLGWDRDDPDQLVLDEPVPGKAA